ncbi:helix-turn-helix domain-containing protein [Streptomyces sp. NBC_00080]|uniref:transcriptional regulator n=1 Tax=Streptomyces sp. NBC_00080 TaxID=2975645 RepID=UPI0032476E6A
MTDHLKDPQAVSWGELAEDFASTDAGKDQIQKVAQAMVLASCVHRLAELRKRQHTTQVQVAEAMGVTQARVSRIEKGQLERSEVDTLAALDSSTVDRLARRHPASRAGRASSSVCSARLTSSPGRSPRKTAGRQRAGRVRRVGRLCPGDVQADAVCEPRPEESEAEPGAPGTQAGHVPRGDPAHGSRYAQ